jgi:hypothetical protein
MKGKIVKLAGEVYLTKADFHIMAKDLEVNTLVFCHSEIHMNDEKECIRHSAKGDHCYTCQPLIASSKSFDGVPVIENLSNVDDMVDFDIEYFQDETGVKFHIEDNKR